MQEIKIKIGEREYILNNNSDKYERAKREAGDKALPETILAIYDRLAGLIKDMQGNEIKSGSFWEAYKRRKEEQPKYIKILEDREKNLEESEKHVIELSLKNIDHKRAFLNAIMTISAAIIAGLFILLTNNDIDTCLSLLALIGGSSLAVFITLAGIYLIYLLAGESKQLDKTLKFIQKSQKDFIGSVGVTIIDIDSYEKFRYKREKESEKLKKEINFSSEFWFIFVSVLFIVSCILLLATFLSVNISILCKYLI